MIAPERWWPKVVATEHVLFTGFGEDGNGWDVLDWLHGLGVEAHGVGDAIRVTTEERADAWAQPGWWFVVGTRGEVYPVRPQVHDDKYQRDRP